MQRPAPSEFSRMDGSINLDKAIDAGRDARSSALKDAATEIWNLIRIVGTILVTGRRA